MNALKVSGSVRRAMGRNADALAAGIGLPADAQCWQCGEAINLLAARPGSVTLSAVMAAPTVSVPAFGHAEHTASRLFTPAQFQAAATTKPSPIAGGDASRLLVDGTDDIRIIDTGPRQSFLEDGPGEEEILRTPGLREHLLGLAAEVQAAGSDEEALRIMREATGLSMTDLAADQETLAARVARSRGAKILTVRCPSCGQLPDLVISPGQAYCGNDGCEALQYAPDLDAFEQLANRTEMGPLVGPGAIPQEVADAAAARRPRQVRGSADDDVREAKIRDLFHRWGYTCADPNGSCAVCDWHPDAGPGADPGE